jgi:ATP-binding cassette subfamily B protein
LTEDLCRFRDRPIAFFARYIVRSPVAHGVILFAVLGAVACSVSTQYGVKRLVDALARNSGAASPWAAFLLIVAFVAADNLLWRLASWVASQAFVKVTGDMRSELFRHLTGHAPAYFAESLPGMLTSRVTATSNAMFQIENMMMWNVLPPASPLSARSSFSAW